MEIKAIEINGNIIILEDVASVSALKKWKDYYTDFHFEVGYKNGNTKVVFDPPKESPYYTNAGNGVICISSDIPLEELRDKIVKTIGEKKKLDGEKATEVLKKLNVK